MVSATMTGLSPPSRSTTTLVQPVVDTHRAVGHRKRRIRHHRQQRQREKAVRDRAAERRLLRPLLVDVDPLKVASRLRELVDPVLQDLDPG
jgi:hypothetical protein